MSVTPGEICTISAARQYGIYSPKGVLQNAYSDTRTYSSSVVNDRRRPKHLCTENGSVATKVCSVEYGFGFTSRNSDQCIAGTSCPPGFTMSDASDPSRCVKPVIVKESNKSTRCDEKWYDWFTVENYHLGNKYDTVNEKCMKPCPPEQMPMLMVDPVDGKSVNNAAFTDRSKCISKGDYLNGKYSGESDFCPMTWIHRLGATKDSLNAEMLKRVGTQTADQNPAFRAELNARLEDDAEQVLIKCNNYLENISASSAPTDLACNKSSFQTPERVDQAYQICRKVLDTPDALKSSWVKDGIVDETEAGTKMEILKQACDQMFCYKNTNLPLLLRKPSICFNTRTQNVRAYNEGGASAEHRRFHVASASAGAGGGARSAGSGSAGIAGALTGGATGAGASTGGFETVDPVAHKPVNYGEDFTNDFSTKAKTYIRWLLVAFIGVFMLMILAQLIKLFNKIQGKIAVVT